jgi:SAM-dependent methyltransferase
MEEIDHASRVHEYWKAVNILKQWEQGACALALLRASLDAGILDATREGCSLSGIASTTDLEEGVISDLCQGLLQLGVLERTNGRFKLSPSFLVLTAPDAPQTLANWLGTSGVWVRALEECHTDQKPYQSLPSDVLVTIARGAWGLPSSPQALASFSGLDMSIPEIQELWRHGGLHMELGCGVGRDLLRIAVSYPKVSVVGVDLSREVLDEVSAQARSLGIADRVQVRCCDACEIKEVGIYNTIMWSQIFFPPETRKQTAHIALQALKPGGYLLLPLDINYSPMDRLVLQHWGLSCFNAGEIREELEQAGFEFVHLVDHPRIDYLVMRSPVIS